MTLSLGWQVTQFCLTNGTGQADGLCWFHHGFLLGQRYYQGRALVCLAGPASEARWLTEGGLVADEDREIAACASLVLGGGRGDLSLAEELIRGAIRYSLPDTPKQHLWALMSRASAVVAYYWPVVRHLADALLAKRELPGDEVRLAYRRECRRLQLRSRWGGPLCCRPVPVRRRRRAESGAG
ncbi:MAG TPA: hypothetical protein VFW33_04855 [Gemmataceae bacterium]|nr:hypothetical protein [Gemmataceae bacterium]